MGICATVWFLAFYRYNAVTCASVSWKMGFGGRMVRTFSEDGAAGVAGTQPTLLRQVNDDVGPRSQIGTVVLVAEKSDVGSVCLVAEGAERGFFGSVALREVCEWFASG